ncbi:integrase [Bradyrhizobium sp. RT6a]|uniref:tyrosine-type recombinase/integrase n=1 Tax=unclassified Bradyrhizobium TaxID=2631580 RepID=UPI0033967EC6
MITDTQCRKAKPAEKPFKLTDGGGLYLHVTPAGGKHWRCRYEFAGKEKVLTFGPYPAISLTDARAKRDSAKATLRTGRDPSVVRKLEKANLAFSDQATFESIAREWHTLNKMRWTPVHAGDVLRSLERDVFPDLGALPIREIQAPAILNTLRKIESRPAIETARRVRQRMSEVFVYAIASGRADTDPASMVQSALAPLIKGQRAAVTDLGGVRAVLMKFESEPAHAVTKLAHRLLALTAVRPGTLITTPWTEFDGLDSGVWTIPAARMKLIRKRKQDDDYDHLVPLSRQAREVIDLLRTITGGGRYAFPNTRHIHQPLSENAIGYHLNRVGYRDKHVPHGWRSSFSTIMNEAYPGDHAVIELVLAHKPANEVAAAYNRAKHLQRRRELLQIWADLILADAVPAGSLLHGPRR